MVNRFANFIVRHALQCSLVLTLGSMSFGQAFAQEAGFESLFGGKDLTGWGLRRTTEEQLTSRKGWMDGDRNAPPWPIVAEDVSFDGKVSSDDGRFVARDGSLVVTTPAEGRKIQMLYTKREFSNDFVLKLEFRAAPNADSGVFIRGNQLQCRDYLVAGPYKTLKNFKPQDWNELVVSVKGRVAHCTCNGEVLEADRLDQFVSSLPNRKIPIVETWTYPLWHQSSVFLVAIGCLIGEWGLRRWKGMA